MIKKSRVLWLQSRQSDFENGTREFFAHQHTLRSIDATEVFTDLFTASIQPNFICCAFEYLLLGELTLISDLRRRYPHLPLVLITKTPSADLAIWALRVGVHDILCTPVTEEMARTCSQSALKARGVDENEVTSSEDPTERAQPIAALVRSRSARIRQLQRLREQFAAQVDRNLSSRDGAKFCHYSESQFSHRFSEQYGETFAHYKMKCRIERACELLTNPACTIGEVATLVGFTDPSYFTRVFRELTSLTPSGYRSRFLTQPQYFDGEVQPHDMTG